MLKIELANNSFSFRIMLTNVKFKNLNRLQKLNKKYLKMNNMILRIKQSHDAALWLSHELNIYFIY